MTKEATIEAILNRISDPYTDNEEDIAFCDPIELPYATEWLAELRQEDIDNANDGEFRMPNAATPELLMEAFNCRVRLAKRNVTIERLAKAITENDETALFSNYREDMLDLGYVTAEEARDTSLTGLPYFSLSHERVLPGAMDMMTVESDTVSFISSMTAS